VIHVSETWRFVSPIDDKSYWEDSLIQHLLTEHRAVRRLFSKALCADEAVLAEIVTQARDGAACTPELLPKIYQLEVIDDQTSIVQEQIEGRTLDELINHEHFKRPLEFLRYAIQLINDFIMLRQAGARFERIDTTHLVLMESDEFRIRERAVVGRPDSAALASSQLLTRLIQLPRNGVYASSLPADQPAEFDAIARLFLQMAANSTKVELETWKNKTPRLEYGPDGAFSKYVMELHRGDYNTLEQAKKALLDLRHKEQHRHEQELKGAAPTKRGDSSPPSPSGSRSSRSLMDVAGVPQARPDEGTNPYAPSHSSVSVPKVPAKPTGPAEDTNPYAAPAAGSAASSSSSSSTTRPSLTNLAPPPLQVPIRSQKPFPIAMVGGIITAVAIVVGLGYVALDFLQTTTAAPNNRPTAQIAGPALSTVVNSDRITLDGSPSSDPDKNPLTYKWKVKDGGEGIVIWSEVGSSQGANKPFFSTRSPKLDAQFIRTGKVTLELIVDDGTLSSDPVSIEVEVMPRN
jgi:hypothetical protein